MSLIGENKETTVIDGEGSGSVLYVSANARWFVPKFVIVEVMFIFVVGVSFHVACSAIGGESFCVDRMNMKPLKRSLETWT